MRIAKRKTGASRYGYVKRPEPPQSYTHQVECVVTALYKAQQGAAQLAYFLQEQQGAHHDDTSPLMEAASLIRQAQRWLKKSRKVFKP